MFRHLIAAVLVLSCLSVPVRAQDNACNTPALVQLADYVLASRAEAFSRFETRNYGSTALYLKIIYGDMPEEAATEAVVDLFKANARDSDQLASAFLLSHYGYQKAADILGPEFAPKFFATSSNISLARVFMLSDERAVFLNGLTKLTATDLSQASADVVVALLDQSDDTKLQFAEVAEAKGFYEMSAGFLLARSDLAGWEAFKERHPNIGKAILKYRKWYDLPPLNSHEITQSGEAEHLSNAITAYQLSNILEVEYRLFQPPILSRVVNYTGDLATAARAANDFVEQTKNRNFSPELRIELSRLFLFASLYQVTGIRKDFEAGLSAVTSTQNRPFRDNLLDEYDWLLATSILRYYTRENEDFPSQPSVYLSEKFSMDWPLWLQAAKAVRSGSQIGWASLTPLQTTIFAELLFVFSKDDQLLSLFAGALPDPLLVKLAKDFAIRLDRTCQNFLKRTGSNIYLMSVPMYKFDKPSK